MTNGLASSFEWTWRLFVCLSICLSIHLSVCLNVKCFWGVSWGGDFRVGAGIEEDDDDEIGKLVQLGLVGI